MIQVKIKNKVASLVNKNDFIVCGNNDYQIEFLFDEEWNSQPVKTARFVWNNQYQDVVFTGTVCNVPIINNALFISIGVYAGELRTTTPATITSKKSILCNDPIHVDPPEDIYNQLIELLEKIGVPPEGYEGQVLKKASDEDYDLMWAYEEGGGGGTSDYNQLNNKPSLNDVELRGNKSLHDYGIQPEGNYATKDELPDVSNFITNSVNDLINYYLKSETYNKTEVNNLIGAISTIRFEVVEIKPIVGDTNIIYLVPKTAQTDDIYEEWIYVNDSWELIGSTQVDLTGYAKETWVLTQISNFLTQTQIQNLINTALTGYVTESWVNQQGFIKQHQDISGKEDKNHLTINDTSYEIRLGTEGTDGYITLEVE